MKNRFLLFALLCVLAACSDNESNGAPADQATDSRSRVAGHVEPAVAQRYDGPFGLKAGLGIAELRDITEFSESEQPGVYLSEKVPKAHVDFESYILFASEVHGLCKVTAIGKNIESGSYGTEVQAAFKATKAALTAKYGSSKTFDYAVGFMEDEQYWMMALSGKDRTLATYWDEEEKSSLSPDLNSIVLEVVGLDIDTAYLRLSYEFTNIDACASETASAKNESL